MKSPAAPLGTWAASGQWRSATDEIGWPLWDDPSHIWNKYYLLTPTDDSYTATLGLRNGDEMIDMAPFFGMQRISVPPALLARTVLRWVMRTFVPEHSVHVIKDWDEAASENDGDGLSGLLALGFELPDDFEARFRAAMYDDDVHALCALLFESFC